MCHLHLRSLNALWYFLLSRFYGLFNKKFVDVKVWYCISRMNSKYIKFFWFFFSRRKWFFSQPPTAGGELPYPRNTAKAEPALLKAIIWIICKQMARNTNTFPYNHHLSLWLPILHCTSLLLCANNINWKDLECQPLPAALHEWAASWALWGKLCASSISSGLWRLVFLPGLCHRFPVWPWTNNTSAAHLLTQAW